MYKIYINTNEIIKKALTDLLLNTDFEIVDKNSAHLIITEKKMSSNLPTLILGEDINLPLKLDNLIQGLHSAIEKQNSNNVMTFGNIELHFNNSTILYNGKKYSLTEKEFEIFVALINNKKLSSKQLLDTVWGYADTTNSNTVATHINNIRKKIDENIIKTNDGNYSL